MTLSHDFRSMLRLAPAGVLALTTLLGILMGGVCWDRHVGSRYLLIWWKGEEKVVVGIAWTEANDTIPVVLGIPIASSANVETYINTFDEVCIFVFINDIEITLCSVLKGSHSSESVGLWTQLFAGEWKPTNGKDSLPKIGMEKTYFMFPTSESGGLTSAGPGGPIPALCRTAKSYFRPTSDTLGGRRGRFERWPWETFVSRFFCWAIQSNTFRRSKTSNAVWVQRLYSNYIVDVT